MQVEELKEKIASTTDAELAEVEAFILGLRNDRAAVPIKHPTFEEAAEHVRTDYAHLLHKLSQ